MTQPRLLPCHIANIIPYHCISSEFSFPLNILSDVSPLQPVFVSHYIDASLSLACFVWCVSSQHFTLFYYFHLSIVLLYCCSSLLTPLVDYNPSPLTPGLTLIFFTLSVRISTAHNFTHFPPFTTFTSVIIWLSLSFHTCEPSKHPAIFDFLSLFCLDNFILS